MCDETNAESRKTSDRWIVSERRGLSRSLGQAGLRSLLNARHIEILEIPCTASGPARAVIRAPEAQVRQLDDAHGEILVIAQDRPLDLFGPGPSFTASPRPSIPSAEDKPADHSHKELDDDGK